MRLRLIHTLMAIVFAACCHAQGGDPELQKHYIERGNSYLAREGNHKQDLDSAFFFGRRAVYFIDSSNPHHLLMTNIALELLATAYLHEQNETAAKKIFQQVINSYRQTNDKQREADTWYNQASLLNVFADDPALLDTSFRRASQLYEQIGRLDQKISADYNLGYWHFLRGQQALAEKEFDNLLLLARSRSDRRLLQLLTFGAQIKRYSGSFQQGLSYALDAVKLLPEHDDPSVAHYVYAELALQYEELNEPLKAIYWYDQCLKERVQLDDEHFLYRTAYLMTLQRVKAGKANEAFSMLRKIENTKPPRTSIGKAVLSQSLACCLNAMGEYHDAEKHFMVVAAVMDKYEDPEERFIANFDIGQFYVTQKQYTKAEPYVEGALKNIAGPGVARVKDFYLLKFKVDSAAGRLLSAINSYQQYKQLNDSLFNEAKSKQIEELSIKYEVQEKERNLALLQTRSAAQQRGLEQAKLTRNLILAAVGMLLLVMALLYNRYKVKQKLNSKLEASQEEIARKNNALERLVTEKEWLLKEIHHRVKNNLHTIVGLLDAQAGYLKTEEARTAISDSQHRVQAMSIIHQKLFHSDTLSDINMSEYIHELAGYLEHCFGTDGRIQFMIDIDELTMDISYALPISLILNEAITNAIKYAFPENNRGIVSIRLKHEAANNYHLVIADSGVGIPEDLSNRRSNSMGLSLMNGLSEDIHGSFSINANNGTEILIRFSYEAPGGQQIHIS